MLDIADSVEFGVAHIEVAGSEVDFCAESILSFGKLACSHSAEEVKAFFNRSVSERRDGGMSEVAPVFLELLGGQLANISVTVLY